MIKIEISSTIDGYFFNIFKNISLLLCKRNLNVEVKILPLGALLAIYLCAY